MSKFVIRNITKVMGDDAGVTALEYAVIAAGIVTAVSAAAVALGGKLTTAFGSFLP